jgi:hypothetical protein
MKKKELLANFGKTSRSPLYRAGRISNIMIPVASQIWAKNFTYAQLNRRRAEK